MSAIEAVAAVIAVEEGAKKRRPEPWRKAVTYFSIHDIWLWDTRATRTSGDPICPVCRGHEDTGEFRGNHLRAKFPHLVILDMNTIGGPESGGGGLVHPWCRCYLIRKIVEEPE